MTPLVHVILVNWNGYEDTVACVLSCLGMSYPRFHVVVVDNASQDGSGVRLRERFAAENRVSTVHNDANLGFAGGNNAGIAFAREAGADSVWLLNNDTTVEPDALLHLVEAAESHPEAGILGSKILYHDHPDTLWFAGGFVSPVRDGGAAHRGIGEVDRGQYDETETVDYITGCSMYLSLSTIAAIGPMAEDYFLYWEEVDWCARAAEVGLTCLYVPASVVYHKVGASFGSRTALQARYEMRNRLLYYRRHRRGSLPRVLVHVLKNALSCALRGRSGEAGTLLHAVADFAFGKRGPIAY